MQALQPEIIRLGQVDSTNREVFRRLEKSKLSEGTTIVAYEQLAGRGQGSTSWESAAGKNLTFSLVLKPEFLPPARQFLLNQVIALGLREGLAGLVPVETITIKWPNDIYCGKGKVSGTLIENKILGNHYSLSVAGIGINVNQDVFLSDAPNPLSLKSICKHEFILDEVLQACLAAVFFWYNKLRNGHLETIGKSYLQYMMGFGKLMQFTDAGGAFRGTISGIDEYGRLQILRENGKTQTYDIKEVQFVL